VCEKLWIFVNLKQVTVLFFLSQFSFSQVYISSSTNFHISHISDTFYSGFSSVTLSSNITSAGVFNLSHVGSLWGYNSPFVSNLVISHFNVCILGERISCRVLQLNNGNLWYENVISNKLYSNKYPSIFFYCDNSICFLRCIECKEILVGKITLYSSISLNIPTPPP
jgi:hypothetical protein